MYVLIITYNDNNVIITILIPTLLLLLIIIISTNYIVVCTYITVCTVLTHLMGTDAMSWVAEYLWLPSYPVICICTPRSSLTLPKVFADIHSTELYVILCTIQGQHCYCRSSRVHISIQVSDNMHWSMQFTHIRSKLVPSFFYPFCLNHFPVHLQVRLSADAVFYCEGQVMLPRPAPPLSLLLPSPCSSLPSLHIDPAPVGLFCLPVSFVPQTSSSPSFFLRTGGGGEDMTNSPHSPPPPTGVQHWGLKHSSTSQVG